MEHADGRKAPTGRLGRGCLLEILGGFALTLICGYCVDYLLNPWAHGILGGRSPAGTWTGSVKVKNPAGVRSVLVVELHRGDYWADWFSSKPDSGGADLEGVATFCTENGKNWRYRVTGKVQGWRGKTVGLTLDAALSPGATGYRLAKPLDLAWRGGAVLEATAR